ncbi:MAG: M28 family peptidase, partial [Elusimicrobiota bacterium]
VKILKKGKYVSVKSSVMVNSSSTPGGKEVQGEIVWLEMPEQEHFLKRNSLKNKVLFYFGPMPENLNVHKKIVNANPLAIVHIDDRVPFAWTKEDALYPYWVKCAGTPPTITIPYSAAWEIKKNGVKNIKLRVDALHKRTKSANVIGEIRGNSPDAGIIVITCHHDTQCNNQGADDNASGVVSVLFLARIMAKRNYRHTIRFLSCGTEEQLSPGSSSYVLSHKKELKNIAFICNIDAISSVLGHTILGGACTPRLGKEICKTFRRNGLPVRYNEEVTPFADHFAFTVFGIPAIWIHRKSTAEGRWQHHSIHDNLKNVSADEIVKIIKATCALLDALDKKYGRDFGGIPTKQRIITRKYARDMYGIKI